MAVIGIDVGGTKTAGLLLEDGKVSERLTLPTDTSSSDTVMEGIAEACSRLMERSESLGLEAEAVGLGVAGFIDYRRGVVTEAPNLPLREAPVRDILEDRCGIPVHVDNDANVAALAEALLGAGKGSRYLVHLTLGTGIGGGIVLDGRIYRGALGAAAELGHIVILEDGPPCNCGSRGCLEALASGVAICRRVQELAEKGIESPLVEVYLRDPEGLHAEAVGEQADRGERHAVQIMADAGRHLGVGIASLVNVFNPDVVTLSGGLLGSFHHLEETMRLAVEELSVPISGRHVKVLTTSLGGEGGALGAAMLPFTA